MRAVKIAMKENARISNNPKDISGIFIENETGDVKRYDTAELYDILREEPGMDVYINNSSSRLVPSRAANGQKYVRSKPGRSMVDELMRLPRC